MQAENNKKKDVMKKKLTLHFEQVSVKNLHKCMSQLLMQTITGQVTFEYKLHNWKLFFISFEKSLISGYIYSTYRLFLTKKL